MCLGEYTQRYLGHIYREQFPLVLWSYTRRTREAMGEVCHGTEI